MLLYVTLSGGIVNGFKLTHKRKHGNLFICLLSVLLPSSCHPPHCWKNIPYSLAFRLRRICSEEAAFHKRLRELQTMLTEGEYPKRVIDAAFDRVKKLWREQTLQKIELPKKKLLLSLLMTQGYQMLAKSFRNISKPWLWIQSWKKLFLRVSRLDSKDTGTLKKHYAGQGFMTI